MTKAINASQIKREWVVLDAEGKNFGRLLTEVATILRGKNKPYFTPNVDCGDFVVIINASKVSFTGSLVLRCPLYRYCPFCNQQQSLHFH